MANFDLANVSTSVLSAAQSAAGGTWDKIKHDFAADLEGVLRSAANIAQQLEAGQISEAEAEVLVRNQSSILFILEREVEQDAKLVVQNAVNAAIDALMAAVKTAAGV
jgi:hypothetical protein